MKKKALLAIIFLGFLIRVWNISQVPPHLTTDEAALGYNAYSILKTARDEYGEFLPIIFKSFGDFKPGLYIYLTVPSVFLFGLNEFSVRLPSVLFGTLGIYLVYLISRKLFPGKKVKFGKRKFDFSLLPSFLLAITPWHIHFSRGAWEINVSLTLTLIGIYFFLKSFKEKRNLIISAIFFALTLVTYQGAKLASSLVLLSLILVYWKEVKKFFSHRKKLALSILVGLIISLPIIFSLFQGKAGRLTVFSVFSYPRPEEHLQAFLDQGGESLGDISYYLFHSETLNFKRVTLGHWFNHYSDRFLYFVGDWQNVRHSAPYVGMFLFADIILVLLGFYALVNEKKKSKYFIFIWALLAPLPAVLSRDQVHAVRSYNLLIPIVFMNAFGLSLILNWFERKNLKKVLMFGSFVLLYLGSFIYYLDAYFVHLTKLDARYWEYGFREMVETVTPIQNNYDEVKVQQSFSQPYIFFLFYQKYDPAKYQEQAKLVESRFKGDVGQVERLDNICFCPIDWSRNRGESGTLFVADPVRIPPGDSSDEDEFRIIKEIKYPDSLNTEFRIVEIK